MTLSQMLPYVVHKSHVYVSQSFVWVDTSQPMAAKVNVQLAAGAFVSGSDECRVTPCR